MDDRLDKLFRAYREACPDRDPAPDFLPRLWERIEARQNNVFSFYRLAQGFLTAAAAAACLLFGALMALPSNRSSLTVSYVEALAEESAPEHIIYDIAQADLADRRPEAVPPR
jgi:hypothetical protein